MSRCDPVAVLQVRNAGQAGGQFESFIVGLAAVRAIAAADDRHGNAAGLIPTSEPGDQRSFSGAADGQVADTDDGGGDFVDLLGNLVEAEVAPGDRPAVGLL